MGMRVGGDRLTLLSRSEVVTRTRRGSPGADEDNVDVVEVDVETIGSRCGISSSSLELELDPGSETLLNVCDICLRLFLGYSASEERSSSVVELGSWSLSSSVVSSSDCNLI